MATPTSRRCILPSVLMAVLAVPIAPAAFAQTSSTPSESASSAAAAQRSSVVTSDGLSIHYYIHGDVTSGKTPLLVLHGAYMSADSMTPFVERFARTRPVIVIDQRGHGRTGDVEGPITYEALADDAASVLDAAGVRQVDVFGYSMGGSAAIQLAIRHPDRVAKLIPVSAGTRLDATYAEVLAGISHITPGAFENTPIRREYDRLAPRPEDFPVLVEKLKLLDATPYDWDARMRGIAHKTMIVMGDHDIMGPEHAVEMFRMRGGGAPSVAAQGFLTSSPPARLLVLPATSHVGVMTEAETIVALVSPFLDDATPQMPPGFL